MEKPIEKEVRDRIISHIPVGYDNRVGREYLVKVTGCSDRIVRKAIEVAVRSQEVIIINVDKGYFIPDLEDENDVRRFHFFVSQESARANSVHEKVASYNAMFDVAIAQME